MLEHLTFMDRAFVLHQLYPEKISDLLDFMELQALLILSDQENGINHWTHEIISFSDWMTRVNELLQIIVANKKVMIEDPKFFSRMLFTVRLRVVIVFQISIYVMSCTDQLLEFNRTLINFFIHLGDYSLN